MKSVFVVGLIFLFCAMSVFAVDTTCCHMTLLNGKNIYRILPTIHCVSNSTKVSIQPVDMSFCANQTRPMLPSGNLTHMNVTRPILSPTPLKQVATPKPQIPNLPPKQSNFTSLPKLNLTLPRINFTSKNRSIEPNVEPNLTISVSPINYINNQKRELDMGKVKIWVKNLQEETELKDIFNKIDKNTEDQKILTRLNDPTLEITSNNEIEVTGIKSVKLWWVFPMERKYAYSYDSTTNILTKKAKFTDLFFQENPVNST